MSVDTLYFKHEELIATLPINEDEFIFRLSTDEITPFPPTPISYEDMRLLLKEYVTSKVNELKYMRYLNTYGDTEFFIEVEKDQIRYLNNGLYCEITKDQETLSVGIDKVRLVGEIISEFKKYCKQE